MSATNYLLPGVSPIYQIQKNRQTLRHYAVMINKISNRNLKSSYDVNKSDIYRNEPFF